MTAEVAHHRQLAPLPTPLPYERSRPHRPFRLAATTESVRRAHVPASNAQSAAVRRSVRGTAMSSYHQVGQQDDDADDGTALGVDAPNTLSAQSTTGGSAPSANRAAASNAPAIDAGAAGGAPRPLAPRNVNQAPPTAPASTPWLTSSLSSVWRTLTAPEPPLPTPAVRARLEEGQARRTVSRGTATGHTARGLRRPLPRAQPAGGTVPVSNTPPRAGAASLVTRHPPSTLLRHPSDRPPHARSPRRCARSHASPLRPRLQWRPAPQRPCCRRSLRARTPRHSRPRPRAVCRCSCSCTRSCTRTRRRSSWARWRTRRCAERAARWRRDVAVPAHVVLRGKRCAEGRCASAYQRRHGSVGW